MLGTHRGYDAGALAMARELAASLDAPLVSSNFSRLLVDLNRSLSNPGAWSEMTRSLSIPDKQRIAERYYAPHHGRVAAIVDGAVSSGHRVIHVASHSFTPVLNGHVRTADVGLLYDPGRPGEVAFCDAWLAALKTADPSLRLRRNYPYIGKSDGVTQSLRRRHSAKRYVGIELEVNQRYVEAGGPAWTKLRKTLVDTLGVALQRRD